jgi:outer membrane lipoprotein carrier protein
VTRLVLAALLAFPVLADETPLEPLLNAVERRYNSAKTLEVSFEQAFTGHGRTRTESGELYLRKPGRMRWEYSKPSGKLFVSDGKDVYYYNPGTNMAEKMKLRETDDMRAPLAFLLGRLDFEKDFQNFQTKQDPSGVIVIAEPRSDKLPYRQVEFLVGPLYDIRRLRVTGQDNSLLAFLFRNEKLNPSLSEGLFRFQLPDGAAWTDGTEGTKQ